MDFPEPINPLTEINWDIRRQGRAWGAGEAFTRYDLTPGKIEMYEGQLFFSEEDRLTMLGLLLENVGADVAIRFGDPQVWRDAIAALEK